MSQPNGVARRRADLLLRYVAHTAAADALAAELKRQAEAAYRDQGSLDSWRIAETGRVSASATHDAVHVSDPAAFLNWVAFTRPDEIEVVRQVRPSSQEAILKRLKPVRDPQQIRQMAPGETCDCHDEEGTIVPGVTWRRGGLYAGASITPDGALRREFAAYARAYVEGAPMPALDPPSAPDAVLADTPGESAVHDSGPGDVSVTS